ncbi:tetratricopeptide repeat protein [Lampropedia puyangensis]|nr:tetratricopeptide repeat protein [Lampropedia puyangensis]
MFLLRSFVACYPHPLQRLLVSSISACALVFAALPHAAAQTQAHTTIQSLLSNGQNKQALEQAEQALQATPRDPQLQFLKANAETALGQTEAAEETLTALTQTYPELAEPWNNLASLRAAQGRLPEARDMLEKALVNNPDYAQAHANLAQVMVQLAISHLEKANQLAPTAQTHAQLSALKAVLPGSQKTQPEATTPDTSSP